MNKINSEFLKKLKRRIKLDEGFRTKPYDDATGKELKKGDVIQGTITWGYGCTYETKEEADHVLQFKLAHIIESDLLIFPEIGNLNEARLLVYISMIYQMGVRGLKGFVKMRQAVKKEDWKEAKKEGLDSKWAKEDSPNRAKRLMNIMESGKL